MEGVNGLRVLEKAGAKLGECLQRRGQPAPMAELDPVDWAYVLVRRGDAARSHPQPFTPTLFARSLYPHSPLSLS